jgi:type II secretory pathway component PulF
MPAFTYKAVQPDGALVEGAIDAGGRQQAMVELERRGLRPVRLAEQSAPAAPAARTGTVGGAARFWSLGGGSRRISPTLLENFTRLLSSLLAAGVPFSRALVILHREASTPAAKSKWKEIHDLVVDGMSLSAAMARSPETFPRVYVAMVEAGETGGFLDVVLAQIADFQAREKELRSRVLAALVYPAVLLVLAIAVIIFLLIFFIPRFQLVFRGFNAELPVLTQLIVATSEGVRAYGWIVAAVAAGLFFIFRGWLASGPGRRRWEALLLRLPGIGPLIAQYAMARFCRMLGTLIGAGVPLINGLNVARRSIGNQILIDAVTESIERVREGRPLGTSLAANRDLFPGAVVEMISVAEESGRLDRELVRIAATTESELDRRLKTVVALAEPIMLFLIAGFVGVLFVGMLIPIFSLQDHIR